MKILYFFKSVLIGIPVGVTLLDCMGYIARVEGISMQPALNPDVSHSDYVFLSRFAIRDMNISRGDIISLISPKNPDQNIIKRIVGLEGDIVSTMGYKKEIVKIPEGHCWIEGDHTGSSLDSNSFGPVSLGLLTAKATYVVWPPNRWQSLPSFLPKQRVPVILSKTSSHI